MDWHTDQRDTKEKRRKKMSKRYPFSLRKHAHDLEFRRNRAKNELGRKSINNTLRDGEEARYENLIDNLAEILLTFPDANGVVWLTGRQYGLAKESVVWAESMRSK
jgi:hypothetical protein